MTGTSEAPDTRLGALVDLAPPADGFDAILRRAAEAAADDRPFRRGRPQQHVSQRLRAT